MRPRHGELSAVLSPRCPVILLVVNYMRDAIMPGVWARTSLIHNKRPRPPGISVKCTFVVSPRWRVARAVECGAARRRVFSRAWAYKYLSRLRPRLVGKTRFKLSTQFIVGFTRSPMASRGPGVYVFFGAKYPSSCVLVLRANIGARGGAPRRGGLTGASWAPARASPRRRRSCGSGPPSTAYRDDDIEWKRVRCGRAPSRLQLSGRSSCSSSS